MKRGSSSSLLFVWRRCGDDCVSSHNLKRSIDVDEPVSAATHSVASASERRDFFAIEEAEFKEKKKMTMEIATPAPAPITSPEINIILLPAKTETHKKNMIQREIGLVDLVLIPERSLAFICPPNNNDGEVLTSTVGMKDEAKGKMIEIVLGKSDKFDSLVPPEVANAETEAAAVESQEAASTDA
ncbi:hypothetical protein HID58_084264 [Brassica napus]|uniref:Uncharacterized protein n=1 Tax=Brassica napus TaxID=3708 RepID=A0ABQ7XLM9_BRANA|nr:hypothetical protein HID58_084264 [Brassica napus]